MNAAPPISSLFSGLPDRLDDEAFTTLLERPGLRIERIVSTGHATPEGEWDDQPDDEWVMVLRGHAVLAFAGPVADTDALSETVRSMGPGDCVFIPAHLRHRVVETAAHEPTVWLAVHLAATEYK